MEFTLPEVYSGSQVNLYREKEAFLEHYLKLEKQKFLKVLLLEFQGQPHLQEVWMFTLDEGKNVDTELKFSPEFDKDDGDNYWEAQALENALRSAYVIELRDFCEDRSIKRSALLNEDGTPRFSNLNELLNSIEDC
jgi:hypothetical protein